MIVVLLFPFHGADTGYGNDNGAAEDDAWDAGEHDKGC